MVMKVVIRADASSWIGHGHIMRCLVLAEALGGVGYQVYFACRPQRGDLIDFILKRGFKVISLAPVENNKTPLNNADYLTWLQRSVSDDADDFIEVVGLADVVVTDHYAIDAEWQSVVKSSLQCKIIAIDDLLREHDAELILDHTLGRKESDYHSTGKVLVGCQHALLAPHFAQCREQALDRVLMRRPPKVLLSMGGVDQPNATLHVLKMLVSQRDCLITVLLGPKAPHYQQVKAFCATHDNVTQHDFIDDMATLMIEHNIAIGAPGTTSWERACLGLPSIIIPLADNQTTISHNLVAHHAAIAIDLDELPSKLLSAYDALLAGWDQYRESNLKLCDGLGANRVALAIKNIAEESPQIIELRSAAEADIALIYDWQCHSETRKYALNPQVPDWDEHKAWMGRKLNSPSDYFYIIQDSNALKSLGALRLDRIKAGEYLISIFISPDTFGRGIATQALALVDVIHPNITIHATVIEKNHASQALFERAKYQRLSNEQFIRLPIM
jgi:UDP-2,4-diacetamido-2,4,6-trideoxy-beta-L-altropyranose hydrolase